MQLKTVTKRSGNSVIYDRRKIFNAVAGANRDATTAEDKLKPDDVESVTQDVERAISDRDGIGVEEIQNIVETTLMSHGFFDVAKQYIVYRYKHAQRRDAKKNLMDTYKDIFFADSADIDLKRDNANINADASMGIMLKLGTEGAKFFVDNYVLPEEFAAADKEDWIHIHDKDFSLITLNCCQIDLLKLFHGGFSTGHGFLREPNSIRAYSALACIAIQSNQNDMFGGQSVNAFDYAMAEGVRKSFKKAIKLSVKRAAAFCDIEPNEEKINLDICTYSEGINSAAVENLTEVVGSKALAEKVYKSACRDVEEETHQAMEALIFNFNTLHCLPYHEKIWVFDCRLNTLDTIPIGELAEKFEPNRYKAISINKKTGESELKFITAIQRKDNRRDLVTIIDKAGRKVTVTDNHRVMYLNNNGKILEDIPSDITNVIAPRKFNAIDVSEYILLENFTSRKKQNYTDSVIPVTSDFAKIAGYYVAEGNISGGSQLSFSVCDAEKEEELIGLMKKVYGDNVTFQRYSRENGKPHQINFNVGKIWADACKFYFGANSHEKKIPLEILFAKNPAVKINFLNGYFKCDGSIKPRYANASSVSRLLIKQLHLMMLSLNELTVMNEHITHSEKYGDTHMYEISFCGNAGNRLELEFNFESVRVELRRYSFEFLKDLYYRDFEGRRPHTPLSKDMIDEKSHDNANLRVASKVFSVPIKKWLPSNSGEEFVFDLSVEDNETFLTEDCIFVHNSRAGAQVPFSSINYGMDTSPEGRLVIREVLNATEAGLGNGETPIFPISVFQLKSGVNYNIDDPNYDLFRQACKVSAKRLFPNFTNVDAPYNLQYYKEGDYNSVVATMGCADGDEIVAYKYRGKYYCESLKRLWKRIDVESSLQGLSEYKIPVELEVWDGENGFVQVKTVIKNPDIGNWVRVKFNNGRSILVTEDHPLYTENRGRIHVNELQIGDTIKTYYNLPIQSSDDAITDINLAYALGLIITDGNYSHDICVALDGRTEKDIEEKYIECVKKVWNFDCQIQHYERGEKGNYDLVRICGDQKNLSYYLNKILGGDIKINRSIPREIFSASREVRLSFLAGMIDGDGHISSKSKVQLGSINKELAIQQMALAQSLNYPAKLYLNHYSSENHDKIRYRIEFSMSEEIGQYLGSGKKLDTQCNGVESATQTPTIINVTSIEYIGSLDKESYDLETVTDKFTLSFINSGNCRTRVMSNANGPEQSGSRGNFSFVTINLPKLALESKGNLDEFFRLYDKYITICHDYLLFRLKTIEEKHVYNFPFLMGQGVWLDSDKLKPTDKIKDVLKHASYSIGFCGLAECLVALTGKHHGQSESAQELGLKIVGHLRHRTDEYTKLEKRNWTTFGTPAESTAGQFQRANKKVYGIIKGVTDRDYMTNSSHVPVYFPICAHDKIRIEAPYHALCNAGHIAYIEMDGDPTKNISAFEAVVRAMHDADMGYFSINHPVDRDPVCGYTGIIENECPHCHRKEITRGTFHIDRL